ncbi:MAG: hypothetical protein F6K28_23400 [Microcoleus sp. SIO2G3]|nr:hypothetical protein [Microcoleus sp. SIO2G3]
MSPRPNFHCIKAQFQISRRFLVCSLFVGLISTACATAITTSTPTVSQTPSSTPTDPITQKLVGKWSAWTGNSGDWTTLVFTPNGKFYRLHVLDGGQSVADGWNYTINSKSKLIHLDLKPLKPQVAENEVVKTIFEFTANDLLRLPGWSEIQSGKPRPNGFTNYAHSFSKFSDATTLLLNAKEFGSQGRQSDAGGYGPQVDLGSREFEGQVKPEPTWEGWMNVMFLAQAQQAYHLENGGTFATSIDQLGNNIKPETTYYRYQVEPLGDGTQGLKIVAQAKRPRLKSITGGVFKVESIAGHDVLYAAICRDKQGALIEPEIDLFKNKQTGQAFFESCIPHDTGNY